MAVKIPTHIVQAFSDDLQDAVQHDVRFDYSGRGMHSEKCVGFIVDNPAQVMFHVGLLAAEWQPPSYDEVDEIDWDQALNALGQPRFDNMGLSSIVYFPGIRAV